MPEYIRVLGQFRPKTYTDKEIAEGVFKVIRTAMHAGIRADKTAMDAVSVRSPRWLKRFDIDSARWHQDYSYTGTKLAGVIFLWSSALPTQVRVIETGERIKLRPYEVVAIDNHLCQHRPPLLARYPIIRWLCGRWWARGTGGSYEEYGGLEQYHEVVCDYVRFDSF